MKFFVYYHDGFYDNGDVGFEKFETKSQALLFIQTRLDQSDRKDLSGYELIEGRELKLKPVEVIKRIDAV